MSNLAFPTIPISTLAEPTDNPNVMGAEMFERLVGAIAKFGFLQPVLVRPLPKPSNGHTHIIVDGVHRVHAAHKLGMTAVPYVLADVETGDAVALQVGMNRMRGELDLARVASAFVELAAAGWSHDELTVTGFGADEVAELLRAASDTQEEDVLHGAAQNEPDDCTPADKEWKLEMVFDTKAELQRAKRVLRKLAGKGVDLSAGLLKLIELNE